MVIKKIKFSQQKIADIFKDSGYDIFNIGHDKVALTKSTSNDIFIIDLILHKDAALLIKNTRYTRKRNFRSLNELFLYVNKETSIIKKHKTNV
jgi:hypothetical protein